MKRSEMLENIKLVLEDFYGQDRYHKRVSKSLLNKIEKAGMSPPPKPIFGDVIIREWEQEDE